jgi:hypothetical protein
VIDNSRRGDGVGAHPIVFICSISCISGAGSLMAVPHEKKQRTTIQLVTSMTLHCLIVEGGKNNEDKGSFFLTQYLKSEFICSLTLTGDDVFFISPQQSHQMHNGRWMETQDPHPFPNQNINNSYAFYLSRFL